MIGRCFKLNDRYSTSLRPMVSKIDTSTKARHGETKNLESPKTATRES